MNRSPEVSWNLPYPSQRQPVMASNVVATSQPLAAQAGLNILRQGGNAVDAAIAAAAVMAVIEPCSNGIGGDNFALVWHAGKLHGLNASGRAPRAMTIEHFGAKTEIPARGWDAVTVPGTVSGWVALARKFARLPLARLLEPAIDYAAGGFPVAPLTAKMWAGAPVTFAASSTFAAEFAETFAATFLPQGTAPAPGEKFTNRDLARSLRLIADSQGEAFYRGEIAHKFVAHAKTTGGLFTLEDLASHTADWVDPITVDYHGYRLHEIPPNGQGLAALQALAILEHHDVRGLSPDGADSLHLGIEAMKLAFADAYLHIGDPAYGKVAAAHLLDPAYIRQRAARIDPHRAGDPQAVPPKPGGTILLTTADAGGMMVTLIQSNYQGFGSGIIIPGTGIHLQNRGACFVLAPGHCNQVAGGKRPYHTIIPAFLTRLGAAGQKAVMAFGVMGGFMQPQGHLQVATRLIDFHQNPQAALDAPRWQVTGGRKVLLEAGFDPVVYAELRRRGHEIAIEPRSIRFGSGQAILHLKDCYSAASDCRHDGQAVGF